MAFRVELDFKLFSDVSLYDVYDETGVYVFWNGGAMTIPSYVGEGRVLTRFTEHLRKAWARRPVDGYIALIRDCSPVERKERAVFGEMALLDVCQDIFGQLPTHNRQEGKETGVNKLRRRFGPGHAKFKLQVDGFDPFISPRQPRPTNKTIVYEEHPEDGRYIYDHGWRRRRTP